MRQKPDGTLKSDRELTMDSHPSGYHPWYGDLENEPTKQKDVPGFASSDPHVLDALKGKAYLNSDYLHDDEWLGGRSAPMHACGNVLPTDANLLDDHYETSLRGEPLHESITFRKRARVGQWLSFDGNVMLDYDGSLTNINGANITDPVRCCNSRIQIFDPTDRISALDGLEIPLGLSLNAVETELNEDPYTLAVREMTGAEPDFMLCHREEEALELRLQAACEGIVQDEEGAFVWDKPEAIERKVHALVSGGADLNWADDWGWTCLHCAVSNGNVPAIQALFKVHPLPKLRPRIRASVDSARKRAYTQQGLAPTQTVAETDSHTQREREKEKESEREEESERERERERERESEKKRAWERGVEPQQRERLEPQQRERLALRAQQDERLGA
jgi:hypothetical protein